MNELPLHTKVQVTLKTILSVGKRKNKDVSAKETIIHLLLLNGIT